MSRRDGGVCFCQTLARKRTIANPPNTVVNRTSTGRRRAIGLPFLNRGSSEPAGERDANACRSFLVYS